MKKILLLLSLFTTCFVTSCQQESMMEPAADGFVDATFTLVTQDAGMTRAIGDDVTVDEVVCAVYDVKGMELEELRAVVRIDDGNATSTFDTKLAKGRNYRVVFFAYNSEAEVYDLSDLKNIELKTDNLLSNVANYDAFVGHYDIEAAHTLHSINVQVTLTRPLAQLNLGINAEEKEAAEREGIIVAKSKISVCNVYKAFNAYDNVVVGNATKLVFDMNTIPNNTFEIDGETYHYIAMNYLFVGNANEVKSLVDVELVYETVDGEQNDPTLYFYKVPIQRNYRANIYGKLLTKGGPEATLVKNEVDLNNAIKTGGYIRLEEDVELNGRLYFTNVDVRLDMNGKKISVDENSGADYLFVVYEGSTLIIEGNGIIETATPEPILFYPAGNLVIENGTFIRHIPKGYTGTVNNMFIGTKPSGGWHSTGVTIKGGYFDPGYYPASLQNVNFENLLDGTETLVETDKDIASRGLPGDANVTRKAVKSLVSVSFNLSNNYFKIYGGTFVGANPAWGDEGCMLPTTPQYLRPWSYYQGGFIEGQEFNENGIVLPEGYSITKGTHEDGRPTYTVNYSK